MTAPDVVDRYWPYDGPHTPETVTAAAQALSGLVRYLNNATRRRDTLPDAATVHGVVSELGIVVSRLPQLLAQLEGAADRMAADPSLYDDRRDRPATRTARELAGELAAAQVSVGPLAVRLAEAANRSARLGNEDPR